jgi:hypothetical protein
MSKEAKARILINDLLRRARWRFFDDETGPANIAVELHVKLKKHALDSLGDDFENTSGGFADYLLLDERGVPIAVLEAKSEKTDPLVGKEQAAIRQFFKAYVSDAMVRAIVDAGEFGRLADNPKVSLADLRTLGPWRGIITEYVKDYVSLDTIAA